MSKSEVPVHFMIAQSEGEIDIYPFDEWQRKVGQPGFIPQLPVEWYVEAYLYGVTYRCEEHAESEDTAMGCLICSGPAFYYRPTTEIEDVDWI